MRNINHELFPNNRILIVDDNPSIHNDFRQILTRQTDVAEIAALEAELFGSSDLPLSYESYTLSYAYGGEEAIQKVRDAKNQGIPFALAFVDMRMPAGWDGLKTVERIWKVDGDVQVVLCTAYTDYSRNAIVERLGVSDQLLVLKKPFDVIEISQLACALTRKWNLGKAASDTINELRLSLQERSKQLEEMNRKLSFLEQRIMKDSDEQEPAESS